MRCPICDKEDDLIVFNKITGSFGPCRVCEEIIAECLSEYDPIPGEEVEG